MVDYWGDSFSSSIFWWQYQLVDTDYSRWCRTHKSNILTRFFWAQIACVLMSWSSARGWMEDSFLSFFLLSVGHQTTSCLCWLFSSFRGVSFRDESIILSDVRSTTLIVLDDVRFKWIDFVGDNNNLKRYSRWCWILESNVLVSEIRWIDLNLIFESL
jgi:hypothetical protein